VGSFNHGFDAGLRQAFAGIKPYSLGG